MPCNILHGSDLSDAGQWRRGKSLALTARGCHPYWGDDILTKAVHMHSRDQRCPQVIHTFLTN